MADAELRQLEARWRASRAVADEAAWLAACLRAGATNPAAVRLRAFLGDPAARLALGQGWAPVPLELPPAVDAALDRLCDAGGVIEHALFEPPGDPEDPAAHELVARATALARGEAEALARQAGITSGRRVTLEELAGDRVDLAGRRLLFPSPGGLLPAAEAVASRAAANGYGAGLSEGYGRAFSDPPYPLQASLPEVARLFQTVWAGLVGTWDPEELVAFAWSTEALPSFADGHEWWGGPLWTVAPRDGRGWIGVAASATD